MTAAQLGVAALATLAQFIVGAIWYTPVFGPLWGKIHGFDKLDKKTQQAMMAEMGPLLGWQFAFTGLSSLVLVFLALTFPNYSVYALGMLIWVGFILRSHVEGVLFGGTKREWRITKIAVQAGGSLVSILVGAAVISWLI